METQEEIDAYLDKIIEEAENDLDVVFAKRTKAILEHLSNIYKLSAKGAEIGRTDVYNSARYKKELQLIAESINDHYKESYSKIQALLMATYINNYLRSGQLYEFEAQSSMEYTVPPAETIRLAVLNPIKELTLSVLMNNHRNETIRKINIEIAQGLQAGESYGDIANRIEEQLGFSATKAKRVARTEGGRVQVTARMNSAAHAEQYAKLTKLWSSTLDSHVRTSHRKLDNQKADKDGYFHFKGFKAKGPHLFGVAKLDINCRCDVLYLVNGERPKLRRGKNYEDADYQRRLADRIDKYMGLGLTEKQAEKKAKKEIKPPSLVIPYQSYESWKKTLGRGA